MKAFAVELRVVITIRARTPEAAVRLAEAKVAQAIRGVGNTQIGETRALELESRKD